MCLVAAGFEEAAGVLLADRSKRPCGGLGERFQSSCLRRSDEVLYLGEGFFYGVEVRRVGRKEPQLASLLFDEMPTVAPSFLLAGLQPHRRSHSWHPFSSMRSLTQLLLCKD